MVGIVRKNSYKILDVEERRKRGVVGVYYEFKFVLIMYMYCFDNLKNLVT